MHIVTTLALFVSVVSTCNIVAIDVSRNSIAPNTEFGLWAGHVLSSLCRFSSSALL